MNQGQASQPGGGNPRGGNPGGGKPGGGNPGEGNPGGGIPCGDNPGGGKPSGSNPGGGNIGGNLGGNPGGHQQWWHLPYILQQILFVSDPFQGNINPGTSDGAKLYMKATTSIDDEDKFNVNISNA